MYIVEHEYIQDIIQYTDLAKKIENYEKGGYTLFKILPYEWSGDEQDLSVDSYLLIFRKQKEGVLNL